MRVSNNILLLASCFASALGRDPDGQSSQDNSANIEDAPAHPNIGICPTADDDGGRNLQQSFPTWFGVDVCNLFSPGDVVNFRVECSGATYLDFMITDWGFPGDHFQLKGKNWDTAPNTAVTTSPGGVFQFSVPGRVYNYGGTPWNPGNIDTLVECTYLHGVNVGFGGSGAGSFVFFMSDGSCDVTRTAVEARIDRSP